VAAARVALARGARVVGTDAAPLERLAPEARELQGRGVTLLVGGHEGVEWGSAGVIVVSPGVPPLGPVEAAERAGVAVVGELDFAWQLFAPRLPTVAIGGTNGKSTVTSLVGEMISAAGLRPFVGGNLGTALAEVVPGPGEASPFASLVLEVSSFQSEKMPAMRPRAATILNVTPDHLDRYTGLEAYAAAKGNLLVRMGEGDTIVVPEGDEICLEQARRAQPGARVVTFGPRGQVRILADRIVDEIGGEEYPRRDIRLQGEHNMLNVAASVALAHGFGVGAGAIREALGSFAGLAHRIAFVAEIGGVRYYDDSKGTNVGASVAALRGLAEPRAVLIAGGRDKLGSYEPLVEALAERGRALVLIGEAADRIADAARGKIEVFRAASMDEAVRIANKLALPGDGVLLSPACSSFDMFRDYKDRGDRFVEAVRALGGAAP
jgi:UDP-N-acetylmuramoylalanine--D-glutamate ligase